MTATADHYDPAPGAATAYDTPLGITNPPIDELLERHGGGHRTRQTRTRREPAITGGARS